VALMTGYALDCHIPCLGSQPIRCVHPDPRRHRSRACGSRRGRPLDDRPQPCALGSLSRARDPRPCRRKDDSVTVLEPSGQISHQRQASAPPTDELALSEGVDLSDASSRRKPEPASRETARDSPRRFHQDSSVKGRTGSRVGPRDSTKSNTATRPVVERQTEAWRGYGLGEHSPAPLVDRRLVITPLLSRHPLRAVDL
jgi:hypothetical protein